MSFFSNRIIGMEISPGGIGCALLNGRGGSPLLERTVFEPLPAETLHISHREPHILDLPVFVSHVKSAWASLQTKATRVALSLPDTAGRVMLIELDETWKNHSEALEMIRWKLKKQLSQEPSDLQLDFQVVQRREEGPSSLLVAMVLRNIVEQYEALIQDAGLQPACIDLAGINLVRAFSNRIGDVETTAFISWYNETLGVMLFHDGVPVFWRSKPLPGEAVDGRRLSQELSGSLTAYNRQLEGAPPVKVFCLVPDDPKRMFCNLVSRVCEQAAVPLEISTLYRTDDKATTESVPPTKVIAAIASAAGEIMTKLTLNLATRAYYNRHLFNGILIAVSAILLFLIACGVYVFFTGKLELEHMTADVGRFESQLSTSRAGLSDKELALQQQRVKAINTILEQRSVNPWLQRLSQFETLVPPGIAIVRFSPEAKSNKLSLEGCALRFSEIQALLENMGQSKHFKDALLVSHGESQQPGKDKQIQFVINVEMVTP